MQIEDGHVPGPRLVTAGEFICSTAGTWDDIGIPLDVIKSGRDMFADGVDAVREAVRNRIRSGANVIKVGLSKGEVGDQYGWGDDPYKMSVSYSPEEIRALTDEAHLNKLKVSAHCVGEESVRSAIQNGVDVIEHGFGISDETRKMLVDLNMTVVSTLSMLYFEKAAEEPYHYPQWRRAAIRRHTDAQRADWEKGLEAGVRFALGSDLIGYPVAPQDEAAKEFEIAVQWGMGPDGSDRCRDQSERRGAGARRHDRDRRGRESCGSDSSRTEPTDKHQRVTASVVRGPRWRRRGR